MTEWMAIEQWAECRRLERAGFVFEIRNAQGQSLFSMCTPEVPRAPFDWKGPPVEFRLVPEAPPQHSTPLPEPSSVP
jgi:hypothetical protein